MNTYLNTFSRITLVTAVLIVSSAFFTKLAFGESRHQGHDFNIERMADRLDLNEAVVNSESLPIGRGEI